jgi:hypothetical protein
LLLHYRAKSIVGVGKSVSSGELMRCSLYVKKRARTTGAAELHYVPRAMVKTTQMPAQS